jgi:hypothetical protein
VIRHRKQTTIEEVMYDPKAFDNQIWPQVVLFIEMHWDELGLPIIKDMFDEPYGM